MNKCNHCKWCGCDPDGLYCGQKESMKQSGGFGLNPDVARSDEGPCKQEGWLFEKASDETLIARGLN